MLLPIDTIDLKMCCQEGLEQVKVCNSQLDSISKLAGQEKENAVE